MRNNICLISTLRRPVVAAFLMLLIGSISFAFIARAVEYVVVERENARIERYYVASGRVGHGRNNVAAAAELVRGSAYVAYEDIRRYTSGLLVGMTNADIGEGENVYGDPIPDRTGHSMILVCGTVTEIKHISAVGQPGVPSGNVYITVALDTVLAGYPESVEVGRLVTLSYSGQTVSWSEAGMEQVTVGGRYLFRGYATWPLHRNKSLTLCPLYQGGPYHLALSQDAGIDWDDPSLAGLKLDYQLADFNQHLVKITTTKNMSAMPSVAKTAGMYKLLSGRWLDYEDEQLGEPVCVVEVDFARARGLGIGDTISLSFADLPATYFGYVLEPEKWMLTRAMPLEYIRLANWVPWLATHEDWEDTSNWESWDSWREAPVTEAVPFTIVGTYSKTGPYRLMSSHDRALVFIPDSCLPQGYGQRNEAHISSGRYSFVLKSPLDQDAFLEEAGEALRALGMPAYFLESQVESFIESMTPVRRSAVFTAVVFAAVLVAAMTLAVFIYMGQRRRELAIMRALGIPKAQAVVQMVVPLCLIGGIGILGGGYAAWKYALNKAVRTLSFVKMPDGIWRPMGALPVIWLVGIVGGVMVLMVAFTLIGSALVARQPALELLQGGSGRKARRRRPFAIPKAASEAPPPPITLRPFVVDAIPSGTGRPSIGSVTRHIWRHIWRAPLRSGLSIVVALFFMLALGWLNQAISTNAAQIDALIISMRVEGRMRFSYGGGETVVLTKRTVGRLIESPYLGELYLAADIPDGFVAAAPWDEGDDVPARWGDIRLCAVSHPKPFFPPGVTDIEIEYAKSWGSAMFDADWSESAAIPVLLPVSMVEALDLTLGGEALLFDPNREQPQIRVTVAGQYALTGNVDMTSLVITPLSALDAWEQGQDASVYSSARVMPARQYITSLFTVEWELAKILIRNVGPSVSCRFNATEIMEVVRPMDKNLRLLELLYPVTVVIATVIGCGLALLLVLQNTREAAVMRVLGATRMRARLMLTARQGLLCLLGIMLGLAMLAMLQYKADFTASFAALYFISSSVGAAVSSVLISNRMPLELLQVKE